MDKHNRLSRITEVYAELQTATFNKLQRREGQSNLSWRHEVSMWEQLSQRGKYEMRIRVVSLNVICSIG